jgi:putative flippase GtrA
MHEGPLVAKTVSTLVAIAANWVGNLYWTFGPHGRTRSALEAAEFVAVSVLGMLVGIGCLYASHCLLGLDAVLADNISSNVIGLLVRRSNLRLYRHWVYHPARGHRVRERANVPC